MILAIDIGNTNIVIGCCADGQVIFRERVSTNPTATVLEYAAMLKMAFDMNRADITAVDGAILSSVVPAVTLTMRDAVPQIPASHAARRRPRHQNRPAHPHR